MTLPADLKARLLEDVANRPSPTRREGVVNAIIFVATGVAVAASLFFAFGGVGHGAGRPVWFVGATLAGWIVVASWATWIAWRRRNGALGPPLPWLVVVVCATPVVLFAYMLLWNVAYPESLVPVQGRIGFKCLGLSLAMALWPLVALAFARRASDPVHPRATGAALGAASGAWSGVLVDLWCPASNPSHIALGHVLPIVILSLVGIVLGKRIIAMK